MFHTAALNQLFLPTFLKGGTSVLMGAFDPDRALSLIAEHRVTWMFGVPAMFQAIAQTSRWDAADLSSIRVLMCGGAPVPPALIERYHRRGLTFIQGYGLTETSPGVLLLRAADSLGKVGTAGTPCFFTDVRIAGADGTDAGAGQVGEILVKGPNVTPGYWRNPVATGDAFVEGEWLRSGDAAVVDPDGFATVVDRVKDMYVSGGENVYPAEVEAALHTHPDILDCAVIGVPDERWGEVGRAIVVLRPDAGVAPDSVLASLAERLAKYKIPKSVVAVTELPRNAAGKLLKSELRERYATQEEEQA